MRSTRIVELLTFALGLCLLSGAAYASEREILGAAVQTRISVEDIPKIYKAFEDFKKVNEDISCFDFSILVKDESSFVLFHYRPVVLDDGRTADYYIGDGPCGPSIAYEFSKDGELLGRKFQR